MPNDINETIFRNNLQTLISNTYQSQTIELSMPADGSNNLLTELVNGNEGQDANANTLSVSLTYAPLSDRFI